MTRYCVRAMLCYCVSTVFAVFSLESSATATPSVNPARGDISKVQAAWSTPANAAANGQQFSGSGQSAVSGAEATLTAANGQPTTPEAASSFHVLGDRLKVVFYEHMDLPSDIDQHIGRQPSRLPSSQGLVERAELTGEYIVQQNGFIVLPLLGGVEVAGRTTEQVARGMEKAFRDTLHREASVSLIVIDREPIYIVGRGAKTGTFKYTPGMTVLHAVALAGGADDDRSDVYLRAEQFREREKLEKSTLLLKMQLARWAVLSAEREKSQVETPKRLIELVGALEAKKLINDALRVRALMLSSMQPQTASLQAAIAAARQEAANDTKRISIIQAHHKVRAQRRDLIASMANSASVNAFTFYQVQGDIAEIEEREQEAMTTLTETELRVSKAEQDLKKFELDKNVDLERELLAVVADIAEQTASVSASRRFINELQITTYRMTNADRSPSFEIIRRTQTGSETIMATEMTELIPGDLVRVISEPTGNESQLSH